MSGKKKEKLTFERVEEIYSNIMENLLIVFAFAFMLTVLIGLFMLGVKLLEEGNNSGYSARAEESGKTFKWTKCAVEEGTTVNAAYLWPEETNPVFTSVYRDGKLLEDEKMITIAVGSVYHFRGSSDESVLYTEVYVGAVSELDITSGETGTWYHLLPSAICNEFEESGWIWQTEPEMSDRAYLDLDNSRIMLKSDDYTAVLYGMGLYLDNKYGYVSDAAFTQEDAKFKERFGDAGNLFASALEYYYTKGGELRSTCPMIYAMVADALSQLDNETAQIRENTTTADVTETETENKSEPALMSDLLEYVNTQRTQAGLDSVVWDSADDDNIIVRVSEVYMLPSQTRPDGTDAFTAYTDAVMSEIRITDANTAKDIYDCAASYFLMRDLKSFNCAVYNNVTVLIFVW